MKRPSVRSTFASLCHLMAGIIVGLGFVAAYAKFKASKPDLIELLEVGRNQFQALHLIEWTLIPFLFLWGFILGGNIRIGSTVLAILFLIQMFVILPPLDSRMVRAISGESLPNSTLHLYYVGVSFLLASCLVVLGFLSLGSQRNADIVQN